MIAQDRMRYRIFDLDSVSMGEDEEEVGGAEGEDVDEGDEDSEMMD